MDALWRSRVIGGMGRNTFRSYASSLNSLVGYFESMQWMEPYLGISLDDDLFRVVSWVNHLAVDRGLVRATVSSYITGAKHLLALHLVESAAMGPRKGARHEVVNLAVLTVPLSEHTRVAYRPEWILEGRALWPCHVFVAVGAMYTLALRQGEFIANYGGAPTEHLLMWSNIRFLRVRSEPGGGFEEMGHEELQRQCADGVIVKFTSRKYQSRGVVRDVPMRMRLSSNDGDPRVALWDLTVSVELCAVTLLQFWFINCGIKIGEESSRPVMQLPDGSLLGSRVVIESLRMVSRLHGVCDGDVVIHSLKHGALTTLGEAGCSVVDIAMTGGHKSISSSQPYLHPGEAQGARVSQILGQKRGFIGQSDV